MSEDIIPFDLHKESDSIIKVLGVGGGGGNAVNHMFRQGIQDVDFILCNTDAQVLSTSQVPIKIQLGSTLTEGRGAGNEPELGKQAAIESIDDVMAALGNSTKMVFITAGLGGGTGTGAAPVIAKATRERGILTIGIVTLPFRFEGNKRVNQALIGLQEMSQYVDSLLVIDNEKLREVYGDLTLSNAFSKADDILTVAAKGIAEIITIKGYVNVDFADVKTVMKNSGVALMGSASAEGEDRALRAIKEALSSSLLNSSDIIGAKNILLNFSSGVSEITMEEVSLINEYVQRAAGNNADLIWGNCVDASLGNKISVTVIATGFKTDVIPELFAHEKKMKREIGYEFDYPLKDSSEQDNHDIESVKNIHPDVPIVREDLNEEDKRNNGEIKVLQSQDIGNSNKSEKPGVKTRNSENSNQELAAKKERGAKSSIAKDYRDRIEEYENVPAYIRKGIEIELDDFPESDNTISNLALKSNKSNGFTISQNNPYLNKNID
jgi:cell division protein FtsZ